MALVFVAVVIVTHIPYDHIINAQQNNRHSYLYG